MSSSGLRLFRYRDAPVEISWLSLAVAGFVAASYSSQPIIMLLVGLGFLLSIGLHELAHAIVGTRLGGTVTAIKLNFVGGATYFSQKPASYYRDVATSLAGPFTNLALWQLFSFSSQLSRSTAAYYSANFTAQIIHANSLLAILNLSLGLFNLLPCYPLDGGQALYTLLYKYARPKLAAGLTVLVGGLALYTIFFTSLAGRWFGFNLNVWSQSSLLILFDLALIGFFLYTGYNLFKTVPAPVDLDETGQPLERPLVNTEKGQAGFAAFEAGRTALLKHDWREAATQFSLALELEKEQPAYLDYRAYTYVELREWAEAIADYNRLLERYPGRADWWLARAQTYYNAGDLASARRDLAQAHQLDPANHSVQQFAARFSA